MKLEIRNILEEYTSIRQAEELRVNELLKKLMDENPDFKKARQDYSSSRASQARARLQGRTTDTEKAKAQYAKSLHKACQKSSINPDDLEIKYECADCKDTGFAGEGSKTFCHCLTNRLAKSMISSQNLNVQATFENFDESIFPDKNKIDSEGRSQKEHILHVKSRAVKWCEAFPQTSRQQALLMGATGVGKSYLAGCIANEIIKKGYSVVNCTASGINEAMFKVINERDNSLIQIFKTCDLLIIDDLGVESMIKNVTIETLYDVIEYRLANNGHTIFCTNLNAPAIEKKYGYRLSSRITSAKNTSLMHILGEDLRRSPA